MPIQRKKAYIPRAVAFGGVLRSLRASAHGTSAGVIRFAAPVRSALVHESVYERLKRAIIDGQLEPGRPLSVRGLAAQFGVSATPAREAIRRLIALGALEQTPTRRLMIARMTASRVSELSEARTLLEPKLAARALDAAARTKAVPALVAKLTQLDARLDAAIARSDAAAYGKANSDFHFTLYRAAGAPVLLSVVESLWLQTGPFMRIVVKTLGARELVDQHKEAIEALAGGHRRKLEKAIRLDILEGMTRIRDALHSAS